MNIKNLLPHTEDMILIDDVLLYDIDFILTKTFISDKNAFLSQGKFFSYQCVELMAQSLGCLRGLYAKDGSARLGFLLGVRNFHIYEPFINVNTCVFTYAKMCMQDESGFGIYECSVHYAKDNISLESILDSKMITQGKVNVLNPKDDFLLSLQ